MSNKHKAPKGAEYYTLTADKRNYFRVSDELAVEKWDGGKWQKTDIPLDDLFTTWRYHEIDNIETWLNRFVVFGIVVSILYFALG